RDVDGSLAEMRRWGDARWAWGMMVYAPAGTPLDHPDHEPLYAAAADLDLAVILHTFTVMPPYAPGGQDTWDNLWLQRSAAHPWCGMRNMAALIGSGRAGLGHARAAQAQIAVGQRLPALCPLRAGLRALRSSLGAVDMQDLDRWRGGQHLAESVHPVAGLLA